MAKSLKNDLHVFGMKHGRKEGLVPRILGRFFFFLITTEKFIFLFEMQSETVYSPLKK